MRFDGIANAVRRQEQVAADDQAPATAPAGAGRGGRRQAIVDRLLAETAPKVLPGVPDASAPGPAYLDAPAGYRTVCFFDEAQGIDLTLYARLDVPSEAVYDAWLFLQAVEQAFPAEATADSAESDGFVPAAIGEESCPGCGLIDCECPPGATTHSPRRHRGHRG
ncbi:MAG: hypothetical protein ACYC6A_00670 [Armatimonadota bacterium]